MQDLTTGSIPKHVVRMAMPIGISMLFQALYVLVDLYFVSHIGDTAIAGVASAGNVSFIVMALTQMLGVGTVALIAQAVGRKDRNDANLIFNQSLLLAAVCAAITLVLGYGLSGFYMSHLGANAATAQAGEAYLRWYLPGLALQFAIITMGSALRGTGIIMPGMIVQMATVVINALLAPVLIAGWLTGKPFGVAGAGMATSIAVAAGVVMLLFYFLRMEKYVGFDRSQMHARLAVWKRILVIGLPAGGEFALMFVIVGVVYFIIRDFGAAAQAGYGVGSRVMQSIFLPAMAVAFATAPIAGQNVGAGHHDRVRETFRSAALMSSLLMLLLTLMCQWQPEWFIRFFTSDPAVVAVGSQFLQIISWNFVASGIIFTCSGIFQALGNTVPSLLSSASRLITFALPGLLLSMRPGFELKHLWYLSVATVALQACTSLWLLRGQFQRRLVAVPATGVS
ncbi:MAG TPA: MATE family efflux transporter [Xanthomonadaceae bacterium]|jgi:putative MATE family efflux protein|nr:MATE family efflux transporter [Xanthomonadaceae bacterium]